MRRTAHHQHQQVAGDMQFHQERSTTRRRFVVLARALGAPTAATSTHVPPQHFLSTPADPLRLLHLRPEGLSAAEMCQWRKDGYVVVKGAASAEQVEQVKAWMFERLDLAPGSADEWYDNPAGKPISYNLTVPGGGGGRNVDPISALLPPTHLDAAAAWEIAQNPRTHAAFSSLWQTTALWARVGAATFKPPWRPDQPRTRHICHHGVQPWFALGDALPMHFDYPIDEFSQSETQVLDRHRS